MSRIQPRRYTAIEGFCGAGGLSSGLRQSGFDVRLAFDFDPAAVETYARNLGHHVHKIDARAITGAELLDLACVRVRELDVYAGGSPCQGWSKQRRRGPEDGWDERNDLIFHHARIGAEMLPKFVIFENVPAVLEPRNRVHVDRIQQILHRYRMHAQIVDAADFGTPQRRRRAVLLFVRDDVDGVPELMKFHRQLSVRDAFAGLPCFKTFRSRLDQVLRQSLRHVSPLPARLYYVYTSRKLDANWTHVAQKFLKPCGKAS